MNADRFRDLAEAYGGSIARWPAETQDAAFAFLMRDPAEADAILAEARDLDAALDAAEVPAPSAALRRRVLEAAPPPRRRAPLARWLTG
ncbi:MAG: hypothetical protein ACOY4K_15340, partial [Pseudomonadota bacterium]